MANYVFQYLFTSEITGTQRKIWQDEAATFEISDYSPFGLVTEVPPELAALNDDAPLYELNGLTIYERPAIRFKQRFTDAIERQMVGKFSPDDIARILAEQQGLDADFFMGKIREGYAKGWLRFYLPDGSPYDYKVYPDNYPLPHEYYLGLDGEYSTPDAINAWLEAWGAEYRFNGISGQPKSKKQYKYQTRQRLILEALESLGHQASTDTSGAQVIRYPSYGKGRAGVRSEVKDLVKGHDAFKSKEERFSESSFEDTWSQLINQNDIKPED